MLQEIIDTFEEVKKYIYIIDRENLEPIIIRFKNEHFYHLIGLHKINLDMFFPKQMHSKAKRYKHIKKNVTKYENIINNQIKDKYLLELRIKTFHNILNMLNEVNNTTLYNLKEKVQGSAYNGDYGLLNIIENIYCLLGLKLDSTINDSAVCVPQSWMASNRANKLIYGKPPIYFKKIIAVPINLYNNDMSYI